MSDSRSESRDQDKPEVKESLALVEALEIQLRDSWETIAQLEQELLRAAGRLDRLERKSNALDLQRADLQARFERLKYESAEEIEKYESKVRTMGKKVAKLEKAKNNSRKQQEQASMGSLGLRTIGKAILENFASPRRALGQIRSLRTAAVKPESTKRNVNAASNKEKATFRGHPTVLVLLWAAEAEAIEGAIEQIEKLIWMGCDFDPIFVTDSELFNLFRKRKVAFEYIPSQEAWLTSNDAEAWPLFLQRRMETLLEMYKPSSIITVETDGNWRTFGQGVALALTNAAIQAGN
jgi:hypothetical protein